MSAFDLRKNILGHGGAKNNDKRRSIKKSISAGSFKEIKQVQPVGGWINDAVKLGRARRSDCFLINILPHDNSQTNDENIFLNVQETI